jgi:hypothetical protein
MRWAAALTLLALFLSCSSDLALPLCVVVEHYPILVVDIKY